MKMAFATEKFYSFIITLSFLGILIVPTCKLDISIDAFERGFWGHEKLIDYYNTVRMKIGDRVFPNVIIGTNGWLFYTADKSIDDFQGTNTFSNSELIESQNRFDKLFDQLLQKGIALIVVIAPDKSTIYSEYMPNQIVKEASSQSRLDQFVDYMHKFGKTPIIDLRSELIMARKTEQVFYKTNTHWTPFGEYIAYKKILSQLSHQFPEIVAHPLSDYYEVHAGLIIHDIPRILGTPSIKEDYWTLQPKFETGTNTREIPLSDGTSIRFSRNQKRNLPSILIYHDSFLVGVVPFLEPHFGQITSIPNTPVAGIWNLNWVDQVHPDIVIIEFAERYLNYNLYIPPSQ
jgi:alginate O-acetyltransferase complex protein AlgJ